MTVISLDNFGLPGAQYCFSKANHILTKGDIKLSLPKSLWKCARKDLDKICEAFDITLPDLQYHLIALEDAVTSEDNAKKCNHYSGTWIEDGQMFTQTHNGTALVFPGVVKIVEELTDEEDKKYLVLDINGIQDRISASDFASTETLRRTLANMIGADGWCDKIRSKHIQEISEEIKRTKLANRSYFDGRYHVRGLNDSDMVWKEEWYERVFDSDIDIAKQQVREFYQVYGITGLMVLCYVIGNYLTVRNNERLMAFLVGISGDGKTGVVLNSLKAVGTWADDSDLINLAADGATENAILSMAYTAGIGPYPLDDVKILNDKDATRIIRLIHALYQGSGKARLDKNAEMRSRKNFNCGVILTGECMVNSQSALSRINPILWTRRPDNPIYGNVEVDYIGGAWLNYLQAADLDEEVKSETIKVTGINAFRLNDNQKLFLKVWKHFKICFGLGDLDSEMTAELIIQVNGRADLMQESSEGAKLLDWLRLSFRNGYIQSAVADDGGNFYVDMGLLDEFHKRTGSQKVSMPTYVSQLAESGYKSIELKVVRSGKSTMKAIVIPRAVLEKPHLYGDNSSSSVTWVEQ